jgi:phosphate transport system permease protein
VLVLFVLARILGGRTPGDLTRRQQRRRTRQSQHDVARMSGQDGLDLFQGGPEPAVAPTTSQPTTDVQRVDDRPETAS